MTHNLENAYTQGSIPAIFVKTALPIVLLTSVNGLLTVVDAIILGSFVGPDAIAAVTLMFPAAMLLIALATMVSTGMSSILARLLGAGDIPAARRVFAGAHGLSTILAVVVIALFGLFGRQLVTAVAGGSPTIAAMAYNYLSISVFTAPALFVLSVQSDALRTEGRVPFMAIAGLLVTLANIGFNFAFVAWFELGVAGSAWGTALAQVLALFAIVAYRIDGRARLTLTLRDSRFWRADWGETLSLGAPRSLTFIGISLGAAATIVALRTFGAEHYDASVAAYGVIMRMLSFAFFPLLGMSLALQAMVGNNYGAGLYQRSNDSLKLALLMSLIYSALVEICLMAFRESFGTLFVGDPEVSAEIARIVPVYVAFYVTVGPMMMISSYFQAIGDVRRSAVLALSRTYLFAIPLIFILPWVVGERGIWLGSPIADVMLVVVGAVILQRQSRQRRWGLFRTA